MTFDFAFSPPARAMIAAQWRSFVASIDPDAPEDEDTARNAAALFTQYLRACRQDRYALSTLPPGRFLMPGDMEGSPALTFSPLTISEGARLKRGSMAAMMARRYESYRTHVVRPFFRDHFSRLDRQIVLIDALSALNSGPAAVRDLETAMTDVMTAFRAGVSAQFPANQPGQQGREGGVPVKDMEPQVAVEAARQADAMERPSARRASTRVIGSVIIMHRPQLTEPLLYSNFGESRIALPALRLSGRGRLAGSRLQERLAIGGAGRDV